MIQAIKEWYRFHRTARARVARANAAAEFWMNEAMTLERQYEEAVPSFVFVEYDNGMASTVPNGPEYLGEFLPLDDIQLYLDPYKDRGSA